MYVIVSINSVNKPIVKQSIIMYMYMYLQGPTWRNLYSPEYVCACVFVCVCVCVCVLSVCVCCLCVCVCCLCVCVHLPSGTVQCVWEGIVSASP